MKNNFSVYIDCRTYNQSQYITQTMNGFAIQETTFPFVAVIVDDASTDGSQNIIRDYVEAYFDLSSMLAEQWETEDASFLFAQHKVNTNCFFALVLLKYNFRQAKKDKTPLIRQWMDKSAYIAICEGDDYWTDKSKLQYQVDFLDSHSDYSMCFHKAAILEDVHRDDLVINYHEIEDRDYNIDELFGKWLVPTASIVGRLLIWEKIKNTSKYDYWAGDIFKILGFCKYGKVRGMTREMSVYRINNNGLSTKRISARTWVEHYKCLKHNYPSLSSQLINSKLALALYWLFYEDNTLLGKTFALIQSIWLTPCNSLMTLMKDFYYKLLCIKHNLRKR